MLRRSELEFDAGVHMCVPPVVAWPIQVTAGCIAVPAAALRRMKSRSAVTCGVGRVGFGGK